MAQFSMEIMRLTGSVPRENQQASSRRIIDCFPAIKSKLGRSRDVRYVALRIAEFGRDLISERIKSGLAVAKADGKRLGRQTGERLKSDRIAPKVIALFAEGWSYRWITRDVGISKDTANDILKRNRDLNDDR